MDVSDVTFINLTVLQLAILLSYLATHSQILPLTATFL